MMQVASLYDVLIIGGGPAGLTAALYLARARYRVLVLEKEKFGGQITITQRVVNYPGVPSISGMALAETIRRQAESFGAEVILAEVTGLEGTGVVKTVHTDRGDFKGFGILLATGAHPRRIGFDGEAAFQGRGVAYCATCDGEFFTDRDVYVVGGGFAAAEESVFLTKYARHVTVLIRGDGFKCAASVAEPALHHNKITILPHHEVVRVEGNGMVEQLVVKNNVTGKKRTLSAQDGGPLGVFVFVGYEPETALVKGLVDLDREGYIVTDRAQKTSRDGIYAAGDVCIKPLRQVVTAVGDGALAATELERYAAKMQKKTGLRPQSPHPAKSPEIAVPALHIKETDAEENPLFSADMKRQMKGLFDRMASSLILEVHENESSASKELERYIKNLCSLTDKISYQKGANSTEAAPFVVVLRAEGEPTGLLYYGVPGGHEFTPFLLGLYNAAGPGQPLSEHDRAAILALPAHEIDLIVSLTCRICPDVVTVAQHIAALNPKITVRVRDLVHHGHWKARYHIMGVPCLIVDGGRDVQFGKKTMKDLLDLLA